MRSTYDENQLIPFTDDFIFGMVMQNEEVCSGVLNLILPEGGFDRIELRPQQNPFFAEKPESFVVEIQKTLKFERELRGVRFDAYATAYNKTADIEMLTYREPFLGKRARFYHANMVLDQSEKGMSYGELKAGYVIFICTYDPFECDKPVYRFQMIDENLQLSLDDEGYTIILNTGCSPEKVPERLKAFYAYINNPERQESELVKKIDDRVKKFNSAEWRHRRMTFGYYLDRKLEEGREIGFRQGIEQGENDMQERLNKLLISLADSGRVEEAVQAANDPVLQQKLLEEFGLV